VTDRDIYLAASDRSVLTDPSWADSVSTHVYVRSHISTRESPTHGQSTKILTNLEQGNSDLGRTEEITIHIAHGAGPR